MLLIRYLGELMTFEQVIRRAFYLGQVYWQQADSDSRKENKKSTETLKQLNELIKEHSDGKDFRSSDQG